MAGTMIGKAKKKGIIAAQARADESAWNMFTKKQDYLHTQHQETEKSRRAWEIKKRDEDREYEENRLKKKREYEASPAYRNKLIAETIEKSQTETMQKLIDEGFGWDATKPYKENMEKYRTLFLPFKENAKLAKQFNIDITTKEGLKELNAIKANQKAEALTTKKDKVHQESVKAWLDKYGDHLVTWNKENPDNIVDWEELVNSPDLFRSLQAFATEQESEQEVATSLEKQYANLGLDINNEEDQETFKKIQENKRKNLV